MENLVGRQAEIGVLQEALKTPEADRKNRRQKDRFYYPADLLWRKN